MADEYQFANNAQSTLAADMGGGDVTLQVATGDGGLFPSVSTGDGKCFEILVKQGSTLEWMTCTNRTGDILTVTRGGANSFSAGAFVYHRLSAIALASFLQKGVYRTNAGDPNGLAALYAGEEILDTTNNEWYKHTSGTTWKLMSS